MTTAGVLPMEEWLVGKLATQYQVSRESLEFYLAHETSLSLQILLCMAVLHMVRHPYLYYWMMCHAVDWNPH